jgi:hypothetical protein
MNRKKQLILGAAFVAAGVAVSVLLWMHREKPPTDDPAAQTLTTPSTKSDEPGKMDPAVAGQIRDAYQKNLSDNAPPGMVDPMNGGGSNLPPLPHDPFVVPVGHQVPVDSGPVVDLPPLPTETKSKSPVVVPKTNPEALKDLPELPAPGKTDVPPAPIPPPGN